MTNISRRLPIFLALAILAVAVGGGLAFYQRLSARPVPVTAGKSAAKMPTSPAIEAAWGIRPTMVALTVDNGMLDLRYQVLDPEKAHQMMAALESMPRLVTQDGKTIALAELMTHSSQVEAGRTYYILYPNVKNAVKPGSEVTVVIGSQKLEHVPVR